MFLQLYIYIIILILLTRSTWLSVCVFFYYWIIFLCLNSFGIYRFILFNCDFMVNIVTLRINCHDNVRCWQDFSHLTRDLCKLLVLPSVNQSNSSLVGGLKNKHIFDKPQDDTISSMQTSFSMMVWIASYYTLMVYGIGSTLGQQRNTLMTFK